MPKIYYVNWFRKSAQGKFLWPGFGENSRVLKWVFERCEGTAKAEATPIGNLPAPGSLDVEGLDIAPEAMDELLRVDTQAWLDEIPGTREHYAKFGDRIPAKLQQELDALEQRLKDAN
jgi:phosphoenolpyruvate carboxykinase (GTP)